VKNGDSYHTETDQRRRRKSKKRKIEKKVVSLQNFNKSNYIL